MERWKGLYVPMGQGEQGVRPLGEEVPGAHVDAQEEEEVEPAAGVCMPRGQGEQVIDSGEEE